MPHTSQFSSLSRFVTESVVLNNLQIFKDQCEALRLKPSLLEPQKLGALAAFHEAISEAIGLEDSEYRADRKRVLERSKMTGQAPTIEEADTLLKTMNFQQGNDLASRPSIRRIGSVARLSKLIERPAVSKTEGVKTNFSTYSPKSAW